MVKVEFTGSVEEVSKEILDFVRGNYINLTENIALPKSDTEKAINRAIDNAVEKKESVEKVEEVPTAKLPTAPAKKEDVPVAVATPLPTKIAEYSAQDLQKIAAGWVNKDINNNRVVLVNTLSKFGVKAITSLPQESYGAFIQELKNLGADV